MSEKRARTRLIKILIILGFVISLIITGFVYHFNHNKSYKNEAVQCGDTIYLNGSKYCSVSGQQKCTITDVLICKTNTGIKLYEIKEYPDYEYVAGYQGWDGQIYKKED